MQHRREAEIPGRSAPTASGPGSTIIGGTERDAKESRFMFKSTTPLQRLRESYSMADLPESIRNSKPDDDSQDLAKPLALATVDDIAFAIQLLDDEASGIYRRSAALKQLHDRARRAGALGSENAVEAACRHEERRK